MQFWDLWTPEEKEAQRERERLRDSWCPKKVAAVSQERWGVKRRRSSNPYYTKKDIAAESRSWECITASGSRNHQLLAAMKKRRKSPNLPQDEGAPRLFWVLSQNGGAHPFYGGAPPLFWVLSPRTNKHPSTFQSSPLPPACNIS